MSIPTGRYTVPPRRMPLHCCYRAPGSWHRCSSCCCRPCSLGSTLFQSVWIGLAIQSLPWRRVLLSRHRRSGRSDCPKWYSPCSLPADQWSVHIRQHIRAKLKEDNDDSGNEKKKLGANTIITSGNGFIDALLIISIIVTEISIGMIYYFLHV